MTKFEIPPIPTDDDITNSSLGSGKYFCNGAKWMRDQLAPHQLAAKRMFEALTNISCGSDGCYIDEIIDKALADVQKIYEVKK